MSKEVVVIDLGGTYIRFAKVKKGQVYDFEKQNTPSEKKEIVDSLKRGIKQRLNKNTKGIGISLAGVIKDNKVVKTPNLPFKSFDLKKLLEKEIKTKVAIENDTNCFALGELKQSNKKNFVAITLGTGIGGSIIINGQLYKGQGGAGEFGHMITNRGKEWEYWYKNYRSKKQAECLGQGIANIINILHPDEIVLGGGATKNEKIPLAEVKKETKKYTFLKNIPPIRHSKTKHATLKGAAILIGKIIK